MNNQEPIFRIYQAADYQNFKSLMQSSYAELEDAYASEEEMETLRLLYPQGQIVCELNGKLIGANIGRVVPLDRYTQPHTQAEVIDLERYLPETIAGDSVYGLDVFVDPAYHNLKIGKKLIDLFLEAIFADNLKALVGISRTNNYQQHQQQFDIETYVQKVINKELYDNALSFHLRNGMSYVCISPDYSPSDEKSLGYGVVLISRNPNFDPSKPMYPAREQNLLKFNQQNLNNEPNH